MSSPLSPSSAFMGSDSAVIERFKQFLRIPTISSVADQHPDVSKRCMTWLQAFTDAIGLKSQIIEFVPNRPVFVATREGTDPSLPSILLNSHYDVVPVMREKWDTDPFEAVELENGDIVARGAQDMKCVCTSYLEALLRLSRNRTELKRTIHLSFQPDEEIGGLMGMGNLIQSELFKSWNVGFALDEGIASDTEAFTVFYGERGVMWLQVKASGPTGHGSRFIKHTAMEKLIRSVNHFLEYRAEQEKLYDSHQGCSHAMIKKLDLGDVVTINLTALSGGVTADGGKTYSLNVIPMDAMAGFDVRIPPSIPLSHIEDKIKEWTKEEGVTYEFVHRTNDSDHKTTSTDREKNPYWGVFSDTITRIGLSLNLQIFPAGTDSRYLRGLNIPCLGFSPINHSPMLLHDHNERLNKNIYLRGIDIYVELIKALGNMPETSS